MDPMPDRGHEADSAEVNVGHSLRIVFPRFVVVAEIESDQFFRTFENLPIHHTQFATFPYLANAPGGEEDLAAGFSRIGLRKQPVENPCHEAWASMPASRQRTSCHVSSGQWPKASVFNCSTDSVCSVWNRSRISTRNIRARCGERMHRIAPPQRRG